MMSKKILADVAERAAWTAAQAFLAVFLVTDVSTVKAALCGRRWGGSVGGQGVRRYEGWGTDRRAPGVTMATYRKKPVEIEAALCDDLLVAAGRDWKALPRWVADAYERGDIIFASNFINVRTLEGIMRCDRGSMLIRGVQGEIYPCKPDIFAATYDAVAEE